MVSYIVNELWNLQLNLNEAITQHTYRNMQACVVGIPTPTPSFDRSEQTGETSPVHSIRKGRCPQRNVRNRNSAVNKGSCRNARWSCKKFAFTFSYTFYDSNLSLLVSITIYVFTRFMFMLSKVNRCVDYNSYPKLTGVLVNYNDKRESYQEA